MQIKVYTTKPTGKHGTPNTDRTPMRPAENATRTGKAATSRATPAHARTHRPASIARVATMAYNASIEFITNGYGPERQDVSTNEL